MVVLPTRAPCFFVAFLREPASVLPLFGGWLHCFVGWLQALRLHACLFGFVPSPFPIVNPRLQCPDYTHLPGQGGRFGGGGIHGSEYRVDR